MDGEGPVEPGADALRVGAGGPWYGLWSSVLLQSGTSQLRPSCLTTQATGQPCLRAAGGWGVRNNTRVIGIQEEVDVGGGVR